MARSKQEIKKQRVRVERAEAAASRARARKDRNRRLLVGTMAGFLCIAMIASLGIGFPNPSDIE